MRWAFLALFVVLVINGRVVLWLALFGASLAAALFIGRLYCGFACPMNTLMLPADWLAKKLRTQTGRTPAWLRRGWLPWAALVLSLALMLLSRRLLGINIPVLPIWLGIAVLVTLRYRPSVFHNLVCPFGALQRTFGRFARRSFRVDRDACTGCRRCEKVCPSEAVAVAHGERKAVITTSLCHQCANCQQVCPANAVHYTD